MRRANRIIRPKALQDARWPLILLSSPLRGGRLPDLDETTAWHRLMRLGRNHG
jgi:hypothetical protein